MLGPIVNNSLTKRYYWQTYQCYALRGGSQFQKELGSNKKAEPTGFPERC